MSRLSRTLIGRICELRKNGKTYAEINLYLRLNIPKSTLSYWCSKIVLSKSYESKIRSQNITNLVRARDLALKANKIKRTKYLSGIKNRNYKISKLIVNPHIAKIALAMLCLGEASKYGKSSFALGNSDPKIIVVFLQLLKTCTDFNINKVRCTVQCRADQDISELEEYWKGITNVPNELFYKAQIDPRTIGKPTKKPNYKGVLRVNYLDTNLQLELESLANLIYNKLSKNGPVV